MKKWCESHSLLLGAVGIVAYLLVTFYAGEVVWQNTKVTSFALIILLTFVTIILCIKTKNKASKIMIAFIITVGVIIRAMYIAYTPITERQHDVYSAQDQGHLGYIYTIYKTGTLPNTNNVQFYHPPLHHILSAGWLKLNDCLGMDFNKNLEGLQVLTAIYSSFIMIVAYAILKRVNLKAIYKMIIMAMMAFHPTFILLAGSINNDILMVLLTFLAILYLIKWQEKTNIKNTVILALVTGLAVMTKVSAAIVAVPIAYIFIKEFIKTIEKNKKEIIKIVLLFGVFGIISLTIGLWHPIRNKILFNQPLGSVLIPSQTLYIGDNSFASRFATISLKEIARPFCNMPGDYNIPAFIIKTSLFGEWAFTQIGLIADILKVANMAIILLTIVFIGLHLIKPEKESRILSNILLIYYMVLMISYLIFNMQYPYSCTMDFRYLVPTIFIGIYFLSMGLEKLSKGKWHIVAESIEYVLVMFYVLSIVMFFKI